VHLERRRKTALLGRAIMNGINKGTAPSTRVSNNISKLMDQIIDTEARKSVIFLAQPVNKVTAILTKAHYLRSLLLV
jgi:hypothetical protein